MELMADEMQDFPDGLLQMKKMTDELNTRSIPITTEVMEKQLKFFFQKQQEKEALAAENLIAIDEKLKKAYVLTRSLGIILGTILILLIVSIGYFSFELIETMDDKPREQPTILYNQYLMEIPEQKEDYKSSLQNQINP